MVKDVVDVSLTEEVDTETNEENNSPSASSPPDDCTVQDDCDNTSLELKTSKCVKKIKTNPVLEMIRRKEETQEQFIKTIEKLIAPEVTVEDDIEIFLKSIGSTMKQFTPAEKAEAKRKIFNVVSDIEIRHQGGSTFHTYNYTPSNRSSSATTHSTYSSNSASDQYCDTDVLFSQADY